MIRATKKKKVWCASYWRISQGVSLYQELGDSKGSKSKIGSHKYLYLHLVGPRHEKKEMLQMPSHGWTCPEKSRARIFTLLYPASLVLHMYTWVAGSDLDTQEFIVWWEGRGVDSLCLCRPRGFLYRVLFYHFIVLSLSIWCSDSVDRL
jgi:hypothetical protein